MNLSRCRGRHRCAGVCCTAIPFVIAALLVQGEAALELAADGFAADGVAMCSLAGMWMWAGIERDCLAVDVGIRAGREASRHPCSSMELVAAAMRGPTSGQDAAAWALVRLDVEGGGGCRAMQIASATVSLEDMRQARGQNPKPTRAMATSARRLCWSATDLSLSMKGPATAAQR